MPTLPSSRISTRTRIYAELYASARATGLPNKIRFYANALETSYAQDVEAAIVGKPVGHA